MKVIQFWGIDSEASISGKQDVHTVQICEASGESTGRVFYDPDDFKRWLQHRHNRPEIFYAFTIAFEYGSLAAWEMLDASTKQGAYPWQAWSDAPINLFYIKVGRKRIPIYDVRNLFFQLKHGNSYLTNLAAVGDYLSDFYGVDAHKLPHPLGDEFGLRAPTDEERPYFEKYGIRDAYISALAARWIYENVLDKWLEGAVPIEKIFSWGTVARYYFKLPKIAKFKYGGKKLEFPNYFHKRIFEDATFAGRNEAFQTGCLGKLYYNDVSSLYPTSIIQTQCLLISNTVLWSSDRSEIEDLVGRFSWQQFFEVTGSPFGWIVGDFSTDDDLWGLPIRVGANNHYVTGTMKNHVYNTLDLEAANACVTDVREVWVPVFSDSDPRFVEPMRKYEQLADIKLNGKYKSDIEKFCLKCSLNACSGVIGKSHPRFGATTNLPAYNIMLGQSHLYMSEIFHRFQPVAYVDTDSAFTKNPIKEVIRDCTPYPTLPFQVLRTVPLEVGVKGEGETVIFRGKMYYQSDSSFAFSGWKPFPRYYLKIIHERPTSIDVERQIQRKWRTRDRSVTSFKIGRWWIKREHWGLEKLRHIFRADNKRCRDNRDKDGFSDSYGLFLNGESCGSRAWRSGELGAKVNRSRWLYRKAHREGGAENRCILRR